MGVARAVVLFLVAAVVGGAGLTGRLTPAGSHPGLLTGDDIPAEFESAPLEYRDLPDWCAADPAGTAAPRSTAAELYVSTPQPGAKGSIENIVYRFPPGGAARFMSALRAGDQCPQPVLHAPDGVTVAGDVQPLPMAPLGDDLIAQEIDGGAVGGGLPAGAYGRFARIVVQEGDVVSVVTDAAYGDIPFDTGLRNRLAALAVAQVEGTR